MSGQLPGGVRPASFLSVTTGRRITQLCGESRNHQDSVTKNLEPSKRHQNPLTTSAKSIQINKKIYNDSHHAKITEIFGLH